MFCLVLWARTRDQKKSAMILQKIKADAGKTGEPEVVITVPVFQ